MTLTASRVATWGGWLLLVGLGVWSFVLALKLPLDSWDAYDYLVNARWLAGHDLTRLSQTYRADRPPGISLLVAPLLAVGYQPGQRGGAGLVHLVPWALGVSTVLLLRRELVASVGAGLALVGALLLAFNPLMVHYLPFVMADVPSMTFSFLTLFFAERALTNRKLTDAVWLALSVAAAMLSKYPVAVLGLSIPVANAVWALAGADRPESCSRRVRALVPPRLALPLLGGLAFFLLVEAWVFSRFVPGSAGWFEKLRLGLTSAWGSAGGGAGGGEMDPRSEIPLVLWALFGAPVVLFAVAGLVRVGVTRERRGLLHAAFVLGLVGLFVFVIGHKESRYAFPVVPSLVWLSMYGVAWLKRGGFLVAGAVACLAAAAPPSLAELQRMHDPLYRRPSVLAWARFALDRAGATRPIFQLPVLPQFALYPKDPVVLPLDEFWHYHHFNEGGLSWFFDRRLQALQVQQGVAVRVRHESPWYFVSLPPAWLEAAGEDAVWLGAFPDGAVLLSTSQGWFETRTAAAQPEPPVPFIAIDVKHERLSRSGAEQAVASFPSARGGAVTATRGEGGWMISSSPHESRVYVFDSEGTPRRWTGLLERAPEEVAVIWSEQVSFPVR
ncbi:MAG: glycosyltransferase family 39 protein [Myxococcus sp.]|nr:glycosyltransferase family 39 protein [Myxococcus sp.]